MWAFTSMVPPDGADTASLPGDGEDEVLVRLELGASDLGATPPPTRCHVRAYETTAGWVVLLWSPDGPSDATRAWAKGEIESAEIAFGKIGERTIALECDSLPGEWRTLFSLFDADHVILAADGTAQTQIRGTREEVGEFLSGLGELETESVSILPEADDRVRGDLLTEHQERALGRAAALGYFEVPRRTQLGELADRLDMSTSALSELLRRAQGRLISAYLDDQLGGLESVLDLEVEEPEV